MGTPTEVLEVYWAKTYNCTDLKAYNKAICEYIPTYLTDKMT